MPDDLAYFDFGSTDALIAFIKEKSDDIEYVVIPQSPYMTLTRHGLPVKNVVVGMFIHLVGDERKLITPADAEALLNDGLLNRMRIKIKLANQMA